MESIEIVCSRMFKMLFLYYRTQKEHDRLDMTGGICEISSTNQGKKDKEGYYNDLMGSQKI